MLEPYDETLTTKGLAERRVRRAARTRRRAVRSRARPRGAGHDDFLSGVRSGVNGTPSFYINGARHDESFDTETLLTALQRATASGR
jgi:hypothetical protein